MRYDLFPNPVKCIVSFDCRSSLNKFEAIQMGKLWTIGIDATLKGNPLKLKKSLQAHTNIFQ